MKILPAIALVTALFATAHAQAEENTYTPEDAALLEQCVDTVQDALAGDPENEARLNDCVGVASAVCQEEDTTTVGIVECTMREMGWWDERLNEDYARLKAGLPSDIFASLREAQRAWITYREANCRYQYDLWGGGTIRQIVGAGCWLEMTAQRAIEISGDVEAMGEF